MKRNVKTPELQEIYKVCCEASGVDISKPKRDRETYVYGRACFFITSLKLHPRLSLTRIAGHVNKDHASLLHCIRKSKETYYRCPVFNLMLDSVLLALGIENGSKVNIDEGSRINKLAEKMQDLKKENDRLRVKYQKFKRYKIASLLTLIPNEKEDDFIETRLKPYLAMNGIKTAI